MRTFIVLALAIAVSNSSFLRNLEATEVTVNEITYTTKCFGQTTGGTLEVTIKVGGESTDLKTVKGLTATFSEGTTTNDIKIDIENDPTDPTIQGAKEVTLSKPITKSNACGTYTLKELKDTTKAADNTTPDTKFTFKLPEKQTTSFKIVTDVPVATTGQTASQEVDEGDTSKNTFTVLFSADLAAAPFMFAGNDMTKVIADCKVDTTDKKKLTCTPTKDELKEGENEIYYQKGCATTAEKTGVKVTFTPEEASTFMRLSKIALLIFAFIL